MKPLLAEHRGLGWSDRRIARSAIGVHDEQLIDREFDAQNRGRWRLLVALVSG
jgi:hypothetical protein